MSKEKCPVTWMSADGKNTHSCKYLEGHSWPHECTCGAQKVL